MIINTIKKKNKKRRRKKQVSSKDKLLQLQIDLVGKQLAGHHGINFRLWQMKREILSLRFYPLNIFIRDLWLDYRHQQQVHRLQSTVYLQLVSFIIYWLLLSFFSINCLSKYQSSHDMHHFLILILISYFLPPLLVIKLSCVYLLILNKWLFWLQTTEESLETNSRSIPLLLYRYLKIDNNNLFIF